MPCTRARPTATSAGKRRTAFRSRAFRALWNSGSEGRSRDDGEKKAGREGAPAVTGASTLERASTPRDMYITRVTVQIVGRRARARRTRVFLFAASPGTRRGEDLCSDPPLAGFSLKKNRRAGVKSDSTDYPKLVSLGRPRQRTATPASAPCLGHVAPRRLRVFGVPPLHAQTRSRPRVPRAQGAERAAGGRTRARRFAGTSTHPSSSSRRLAATHGESSSGDSRDGPSHRALSPAPKRCARRLAVSAGPQGARRLSRRRAPPRGGRGNRGEARVGRLLGRPAPPFPNRAPALREPLRNGRAEAVRAAAHAGRVGERIRAAGCAVAARAGNGRGADERVGRRARRAPRRARRLFFRRRRERRRWFFFLLGRRRRRRGPPRVVAAETRRVSPDVAAHSVCVVRV